MTSSRPPSLRELNRTLLARQLLFERVDLPVGRAVSQLVALQAQWAPAAYVALWSGLRSVTTARAPTRAAADRARLVAWWLDREER